MTRNLLTLLIAALALAQAMGAETTPPPATQPAVAPDLSKPVWVILQCDTIKPHTWHTIPKPLGEHIEYATTSKPVTPGIYEYRFDGRRLGAMVAGTVTVKGPDSKEHTCQFLGGVE
jgi:hypothetical protein